MVTAVEPALHQAVADLDAIGARWALIGGLAISVRAVPRFTKDLDFAVAVADDADAEDVVHRLGARGYAPQELVEQEYLERLSGVRLLRGDFPVVVDLMFASSGIEAEVVEGATPIDVLPGLSIPVASTGHLIALKVLAGRHQDLTDLEGLIPEASATDLDVARGALELVRQRGYHRDQDVLADLERALAESRGSGSGRCPGRRPGGR